MKQPVPATLATDSFPPLAFLLLGITILVIPFLTRTELLVLPTGFITWFPLSFSSFHILTEIFSVLVSILVFSTGFHIPEEQRPLAPIFLAAAFLGVGMLDFLHLVSYPGLADFITPNTPQKATLFWMAARLLAAVAMVVYVLLPTTPLPTGAAIRPSLLAASFGYTLIWGYIGIWRADWLPLVYDPARGLTTFNVATEWVVTVLHLAALVLLLAKGDEAVRGNRKTLVVALTMMIAAELCFTLYRELTDATSTLGHLYKIAAYLMIYRGIFLESVRLPLIRLDLTRQALARSEKEWQDTFDAITDPVFIHDHEYRVIRCNRSYAAAARLGNAAIIGRPYYEIFPKTATPAACCRAALSRQEGIAEETYVPELDRYYNIHFIPVNDAKGSYRHSLHVMNDITAHKLHEKELRYRATHDALTGLPNRTLFLDRLNQALHQAKHSNQLVVIMLLDLDNFKAVNNGYGHAVGDEFLVKMATRFRRALRESDTVARLGGDEFAVLLPNFKSIEKTARVVEKIRETFATPILMESGLELYSGASIGIAFFPQDGTDEHTLMRHADLAMYHAKAAGRGTWAFFGPDIDQRLHEDLQLHGRLKHALDEGRFTLHYQPQVETTTGSLVSAEALLRWHDDLLGEVSPVRFIAVAEATGLIHLIDEWVLGEACRQIAAWHRRGQALRVAVNVSAIQFRRQDFVAMVRSCLTATDAPPSLLTLEITETTAMADIAQARRHLEELSTLGVRFALDDFGTGHSSLSYLKSLPINEVKIDRSFIRDIAQDPDDEVIIQAIIGLAHSLNIRVVAEGVETETQRAFLRQHGCDLCQGWLWGRGVPAAEMEERLTGVTA